MPPQNDRVPCMNCEERKMNCHSNCEKYKAFKDGLEKRRIERNRQNEIDNVIRDLRDKRLRSIADSKGLNVHKKK